jgi:hypothetical protein
MQDEEKGDLPCSGMGTAWIPDAVAIMSGWSLGIFL